MRIKKSYIIWYALEYILNTQDIEAFLEDISNFSKDTIKITAKDKEIFTKNFKRFKFYLVLLNLTEAQKQKNFITNEKELLWEIESKSPNILNEGFGEVFDIVKNKIEGDEYFEWLNLFFTTIFWCENKTKNKKFDLWTLVAAAVCWDTENIFIFNQKVSRDLFFERLRGATIYND